MPRNIEIKVKYALSHAYLFLMLETAFKHPFFSRHHDDAKIREAIRDSFGKEQYKVWITGSQNAIKDKIK